MLDQINKFILGGDCLANSQLCSIDKSITFPSFLFIITTFLSSFFIFRYLRSKLSHFIARITIMGLGVVLFELFTAPMWNNYHLGRFGYYYLDTSWIITLCWVSMFLINTYFVDRWHAKRREWQRFLYSLLLPVIFTVIGELLLVGIGVRGYASEVITTSIFQIRGVPIEVLVYAPIFSSFIICFYRFWMFQLDNYPLIPIRRWVTWRNIVISFFGITFFEFLVAPISKSPNLPSWSYIYHDVSLVRIGIWVILISLCATFIDKLFIGMSQSSRYLMHILCISLVFYQVESWLITHELRVYLDSVVANFSGYTTPISHLPIEIAFATILYVALLLGFIRYWRIIWDNKL